ncbi:MAG: DNA mismatch repair protein MutS [Clostridia bacterium]|nr:DNA mismatch repair protein MutS [Clostridia bacterium]
MEAVSLLAPDPEESPVGALGAEPGRRLPGAAGTADPAFDRDLAFDQVVARALEGQPDRFRHGLAELYHAPCRDVATVRHRQEVMRDLGDPALRDALRGLVEGVAEVEDRLRRAEEIRHPQLAQRAHLEAALLLVATLAATADAFRQHPPFSNGLRALAAALDRYLGSPSYRAFADEAQAARDALDRIRYTLTLGSNRVEVMPAWDAPDLGREIAETFARFADAEAAGCVGRDAKPAGSAGHGTGGRIPFLNHVEEAILERIARLAPEPFAQLADFRSHAAEPIPEPLRRVALEGRFLISYLDLVAPLQRAGLPFSLPDVTAPGGADGEDRADDAFDLALALSLRAPGAIVPNGWQLGAGERAIVVTGPNHGGKTTFARAFGLVHHLARLGLPVPARRARLPLFDRILTHFPREEAAGDDRGRLAAEVARFREILDQAGPAVLVVMNEAFAATGSEDAARLGTRALAALLDRGARVVFVTFLDELARLDARVVSMVAEVAPDDPSRRTFRIARRPPEGTAYALAVARRHGVTYELLRKAMGT